MRKLTLSMDPKDIRAARRIADAHRTSISDLFGRQVRTMSPGRRPTAAKQGAAASRPPTLPPATQPLSGILAAPTGRSDRKLIEDAIFDRHGIVADPRR